MAMVQKFYDCLAKDRKRSIHVVLQSSGSSGSNAGAIDAVECFRNAVNSHDGGVTCFVPTYAEGAATLLALSCGAIIATKNTHFTSIVPQIGGLSCADILKFTDAGECKARESHLLDLANLIHPVCVRAQMQAQTSLAQICVEKDLDPEKMEALFMNPDVGPGRPIDIRSVCTVMKTKEAEHKLAAIDDSRIDAIRQFLPSAQPKPKHMYF